MVIFYSYRLSFKSIRRIHIGWFKRFIFLIEIKIGGFFYRNQGKGGISESNFLTVEHGGNMQLKLSSIRPFLFNHNKNTKFYFLPSLKLWICLKFERLLQKLQNKTKSIKITLVSLTELLIGDIHLVGVIFTNWCKIYPFKGKKKLVPFRTELVCNFWGESAIQLGFCKIF